MTIKPLNEHDAAQLRADIKHARDLARMAKSTHDMMQHHEQLIADTREVMQQERERKIAASWDNHIDKLNSRAPTTATSIDLKRDR
jgi:hypothetical protein